LINYFSNIAAEVNKGLNKRWKY